MGTRLQVMDARQPVQLKAGGDARMLRELNQFAQDFVEILSMKLLILKLAMTEIL